MTIGSMLGQSAILTLLGMCVVFGFLVIMICLMNILRIVVHAAKLDVQKTVEQEFPASVPSSSDEKAVVAAIATALHEKK